MSSSAGGRPIGSRECARLSTAPCAPTHGTGRPTTAPATRTSLRLRRQFSLSDRARYYWPVPEVQEAVRRLFANLDAQRLPRGVVSQYLPDAVEAADAGPPDGQAARLARLHVRRVLARYARACGASAAGVAAGVRLPL